MANGTTTPTDALPYAMQLDPETVRSKLADQVRTVADVYLPNVAKAIEQAIAGDEVIWVGPDADVVKAATGGPDPAAKAKLQQELQGFVQNATDEELVKLTQAVRQLADEASPAMSTFADDPGKFRKWIRARISVAPTPRLVAFGERIAGHRRASPRLGAVLEHFGPKMALVRMFADAYPNADERARAARWTMYRLVLQRLSGAQVISAARWLEQHAARR
jgi:hypothetical protein